MLGILGSAMFCAMISVYAFHDVDKDQIGHWNEAFASLCVESLVFTLIVGAGVAVLTFLGRQFFQLGIFRPRLGFVFSLGVGVTLLQYPWDFISRAVLPKFADASLYAFLIIEIVFCSIAIVRDSFKQKKSLSQSLEKA